MRLLFLILFFSTVTFGKGFYFDQVKFDGLNRFTPEFILSKLSSKSKMNGSIFFDYLVSLRLFDHIVVSIDKNILNIKVVEKPFIRSFKFHGEKSDLHLNSLLVDFKLRSGELYDSGLLRLFKFKLEEYYCSKGFYNLDINLKVYYNKKLNCVDIDLLVCKNNLLKINNIIINGNEVYNNRKLLSLFSSSKTNWMSWFTKSDIYLKGKLVSDLRRLKSLYVDNGYIDFQINFVKIFLSKDKKSISILIDLFEGEEHDFGRVLLDGRYSDYVKDKLTLIVSSYITQGKLFSLADLIKVRKNLIDFFYDNGYINTNVDFHVMGLENRSVDVIFSFNVSPRIMVRRIEFVGNSITSDHVLRNFVPQSEEAWISLDGVNFGKQEIIRHGLASNVDISFIKCADSKNTIDIIYKVKEHGASKFMAGCSYLEGDCFVFHISSDLPNFLGTGNDLSFSISRSKNSSDYSLNYLNSKFFGSAFDVSYSIYFKTESFNKDIVHFDHVSDSFGADISYHKNFGRYVKLSFGFGYDKTNLKLTEERSPFEVKRFISKEGIRYKEYYFISNYIFNSLDKPVLPTSGQIKHFNFRLSLPGSSLKYYHLNYDVNYYRKIYDSYILGIYYNICYGNKYFKTVSYPFFKNFFLKGVNNIRGFRDRSLGPRDSNNECMGGNFLFCMKLSLYFPVPILCDLDTVRTSLFFDLGQTYNTEHFSNRPKFRPRFLKYNSFFRLSLGFAVTWSTPFGMPIYFSAAYPLNADYMDRRKTISFSMGMPS